MQPTPITVQANIAADINKVWQFYTAPEHITQWNFATPEWHCPKAENDLRPGGRYCARMEAKDGSFGFDFEAIYDVIDEPNHIVYTIADGRKVTTDFTSHNGQTTVTTVFDAEGQHDAEMQRAGWQAILDNFKQYVERTEAAA